MKPSQQTLTMKKREKISKTQPASNPQTITLDKKYVGLDIQNGSNTQKNPSKISPAGQLILSTERHQFTLMQSQIRKLNKRIQIENQLVRNRKLYKKVEEELKAQEQLMKEQKRLLIKNRIEEMQKSKKQRKEKQVKSDRTVAQLKIKQRKKEYILQRLLEKNKIQHEECYQKALLERKMMLRPMNFQEIQSHEKKYLDGKRIHKTLNYDEEDEEENDSEIYKNISKRLKKRHKGRQNLSESKSLSSRKEGSSQNTKRKVDVRSSIEEYLETRKKEQKRIEELKQLLQRQKQYGNRVEVQFHKNRAKTESIEYNKEKQRLYAEQKAKSINERNKILKNMKKPELPEQFNKNIEERRKQEIQKVIRSNGSTEEKMLKLNMMSEAQYNQLKLRNRPEDLDRLNQINMKRAQLLLNFH